MAHILQITPALPVQLIAPYALAPPLALLALLATTWSTELADHHVLLAPISIILLTVVLTVYLHALNARQEQIVQHVRLTTLSLDRYVLVNALKDSISMAPLVTVQFAHYRVVVSAMRHIVSPVLLINMLTIMRMPYLYAWTPVLMAPMLTTLR